MAHYVIIVFIALLLISSVVAMVTRWIRIPYTVALVIVGLIIGPLHLLPPVSISPELILLIFLPALLFEGAWNLKFEALRANAAPILILATVGVFISVGIVATIIHFGVGLSWNSSLLFGAIISATDPVSVLAVFRKLGAPERLKVIVEGESLFNDGTAAVVFRILLGLVAGTTATSSAPGLLGRALLTFVIEVAGGLVLGVAIGWLVSKLTSYFDDHLLEISLSALAAYGSFLLADYLHVSPVIATIAAGLVIGNYGWHVGMSERTQVAADTFWEYAAFVVNSLVFLLIGLEISSGALWANLAAVLWAVLAMLISRIPVVYGLVPLSNARGEPIPGRWRHVIYWGGLRGSLSIALVLSIPLLVPDRQQLVAMTFGIVVFSLLVQGLTISPLIDGLKLANKRPQA